jgi:hypothetical protein
MKMPTPCQKCDCIFDLNDGRRSEKWFPNTVICSSCAEEEREEIERDNEIYDLKAQISDAEITISGAKDRLKELGITDF